MTEPADPQSRGGEPHWRRLETMYRAAEINRQMFQPQISVGDGHCEIVQATREAFFHGARAVHGSVLFKMLDDAAYFASSSKVTDRFMVTSTFTIFFARPVSSGQLTARGKILFRSAHQTVAEASVFDEREREIARGSGTFVRSRLALEEKYGYR